MSVPRLFLYAIITAIITVVIKEIFGDGAAAWFLGIVGTIAGIWFTPTEIPPPSNHK